MRCRRYCELAQPRCGPGKVSNTCTSLERYINGSIALATTITTSMCNQKEQTRAIEKDIKHAKRTGMYSLIRTYVQGYRDQPLPETPRPNTIPPPPPVQSLALLQPPPSPVPRPNVAWKRLLNTCRRLSGTSPPPSTGTVVSPPKSRRNSLLRVFVVR